MHMHMGRVEGDCGDCGGCPGMVLLHDARCMMQLLEGLGEDGGITLAVMQS